MDSLLVVMAQIEKQYWLKVWCLMFDDLTFSATPLMYGILHTT